MTFQQLQYVLEVYRAGSVSQAAKNLFVGQSSVSLSISNLEKELGYPVFIRSTSGVVLTPRGQEVIEQAARICESYQIITGPEKKDRTRINIGIGNIDVGRKAALRLLDEHKDRTDISFNFGDISRKPQIQQLVLFELDMCLRFAFSQRMHKLEVQLREKQLQWMELGEFPAAIHLGPGHRLYDVQRIDLSMLENDWFIDTAKLSMANNPLVNSVLTVPPERVIPVSDPLLRSQMIKEGFGYTVRAVTPHKPDDLRRIPLENFKMKLLAIYNPARPMRPEVAQYIGLLKEELASKENLIEP